LWDGKRRSKRKMFCFAVHYLNVNRIYTIIAGQGKIYRAKALRGASMN
jgi:hypothetical protein